jgi:hypothetical protein
LGLFFFFHIEETKTPARRSKIKRYSFEFRLSSRSDKIAVSAVCAPQFAAIASALFAPADIDA